jgi:DNA-binding CsgD family transcriptional regulator
MSKAAVDAKPGTTPSPRELEALRIYATGATQKEVAHAMAVPIHTVKSLMANVFCRLEVDNRVAAFVKLGWLKVPER